MSEADLHEGEPRQQHGGEQKHRGDELGQPRTGGGRLLRMLIGMRVRVRMVGRVMSWWLPAA